MNIYLFLVVAVLVSGFVLDLIVDYLNLSSLKASIPKEFDKIYDSKKYKKSQEYLRETTKFSFITSSFSLLLILLAIFSGFFNYLDLFARSFNYGEIITGLIFGLSLIIINLITNIPFSLYATFRIEEKYGFNKTTLITFSTDLLKNLTLMSLIGGAIFALVMYLFINFEFAWIYAWISISLIQLLFMFIYPVLIMPLFNRFTPLKKGELKTEIEKFAANQSFKLQGIYTMDGSKRSTKANAFFTGFGKFKRIVLFDTLIKNHTTEELVSILAHEIGHYKKQHIVKLILVSIATTGAMLYFVSLFVNNENLFEAFRVENLSVYASFLFIGILYNPISMAFGVISNYISRKFEFEADEFAVNNYRNKKAFVAALKRLSVESLSNLTPHPLKVFLEYSHPPVLERIKKIDGSM